LHRQHNFPFCLSIYHLSYPNEKQYICISNQRHALAEPKNNASCPSTAPNPSGLGGLRKTRRRASCTHTLSDFALIPHNGFRLCGAPRQSTSESRTQCPSLHFRNHLRGQDRQPPTTPCPRTRDPASPENPRGADEQKCAETASLKLGPIPAVELAAMGTRLAELYAPFTPDRAPCRTCKLRHWSLEH
jgi:hypothetical protein